MVVVISSLTKPAGKSLDNEERGWLPGLIHTNGFSPDESMIAVGDPATAPEFAGDRGDADVS